MTPAELLAGLVPAALKLAVQCLTAIFKGDAALAARKAEEAALRQGTRIAVDATLRAKAKK
jgi:hypothetical protein